MAQFLAPYPAVRLLAIACTGIVAGACFQLPLFYWITAALICFLLLGIFMFLCRGKPLSNAAVTVYSLFVFCGFSLYTGFLYNYLPSSTVLNWLDKEVLLYGKVVSRPRVYDKGAGWILQTREVFADGEAHEASGNVKVFLRMRQGGEPEVEKGDMIRVKGRVGLIPRAENPGDFDPREYYRKKRVHAELFCYGPWLMHNYGIDESDYFEALLVRPVRRYLSGTIAALVPPGHEQQFIQGVFLGQKELLDREVYRTFKAAGTAHVLAVSGLHVGLIVMVLLVALQRLRITVAGKWIVLVLIAFVLLVYASVTGNAPSVRRASLMVVALTGNSVLSRQSFPLNSLAVADLILLCIDPLELFNAGFLMTNAAVAAIILLYPVLSSPSETWKGVAGEVFRPVWKAFSVSLAAIIGVSPVIAWFFGTFSVVGIIANLPVVFLASCMLYAMLPTFLLNPVLPGLALYPASSSWLFARMTLGVTEFFGDLPWAVMRVQPDGAWITVYYVAVAAVLFFLYRKNPTGVMIAFLCAANYFVWAPVLQAERSSPAFVRIVAGNDTALLCSIGGSSILIDAGSKPYHRETINRQMRRHGIKKLDAAIQFVSPDSLVRAIDAQNYMRSEEHHLAQSSFVVARSGSDALKLWAGDGLSMLFVGDPDALKRLDSERPDRVVVKVKRFGIDDYRRLAEWVDSVHPVECVVLCSPQMKDHDRRLLAHLAGKREEVTIVE